MKQLRDRMKLSTQSVWGSGKTISSNVTSNTEFTTCFQKLTKAAQFLLRRREKQFHSQSQHHPQKAVSFQPPQQVFNNMNNTPRQPFAPAMRNVRQNQTPYVRLPGQHHPQKGPTFTFPFGPRPSQVVCEYCSFRGHVRIFVVNVNATR